MNKVQALKEQTLENGSWHYSFPKEGVFHFKMPEASQGRLYLYYENSEKLECFFEAEENSHWDIIILNQNNIPLELEEVFILKDFSQLKVHMGDFSQAKTRRHLEAKLQGDYADFATNAAVLAHAASDWTLHAHHQNPHTYAHLNTHAIILESGSFDLDVIGDIPKAMHGSKTHQNSRIMNFSDEIAASVHPQLLIENNDVEASHAATVGRPDKEHVYYLQSRGLDEKTALSLMVLGYLMPFLVAIEDETLREDLKKELEGQIFDV